MQQTGTKGMQDKALLDGKKDPLRIVQEIKIWPFNQVVYAFKPESVPENETHKILWNFEVQMDHLISARRPDLVLINQKKRTFSWILLIQQSAELK